MDINSLRKEYKRGELKDDSVHPDPVIQFRKWFDQAVHADIDDVNAVTLATASKDGKPSARIVLLKAFTNEGFTFFTSYEGRKSQELLENPYASLVIFWKELERQVRVEGRVEKVSTKESDKYFDSRSVESRISAIVSPQSQEIPSRRYIEELWINKLKELNEKKIPRPKNWGGYSTIPEKIEFWQGRPNRLNDRILYTLVDDEWKISRLAP